MERNAHNLICHIWCGVKNWSFNGTAAKVTCQLQPQVHFGDTVFNWISQDWGTNFHADYFNLANLLECG